MHDTELAQAYLSEIGRWQAMLRGIIEQGVEAKVFRCASPERAARQIFALAMGYAGGLGSSGDSVGVRGSRLLIDKQS